MAREYFKVFHSYLEAIEPLGDAERGRLFTAMIEYSRTGIVPNLKGNERILFPTMKINIDRDIESYSLTEKRNAENGKKGGRPKNPLGFSETQENPRNPVGFSETQKSQDKDKDKENIKEKDITKVISKKKAVSFCPPTLEEVKKYCIERGNDIDPKRFFDYYNESNWVDGKGDPVKNWKQKLITWEGRGSTNGTVKPTSADNAGRDWGIEYVNS